MSALATRTRLISAEEFAKRAKPADGSREELVRGEVVTMSAVGLQHGEVELQIGHLLKLYLKGKNLGRAVVESGVRTEEAPDTVRAPDVSYWSYERVPRASTEKPYPRERADLCVEIRSASNTRRSLREKAAEYLAAGVRMVWVVDPEDQSVTVYRKPNRGVTLWDDQILEGEEVLPGFQCKVSEFFAQE